MKQEHALNDRQRDILNIIIISHIQSAVPVGSGAVSDMLGLSSATIRNVMAELEDMGYISKPHTSAGRIPTPAGYRYYVDNLLEAESVSDQQKRFIDHEYQRKTRHEDPKNQPKPFSSVIKELGHQLAELFEECFPFFPSGKSSRAFGAVLLTTPQFTAQERNKRKGRTKRRHKGESYRIR